MLKFLRRVHNTAIPTVLGSSFTNRGAVRSYTVPVSSTLDHSLFSQSARKEIQATLRQVKELMDEAKFESAKKILRGVLPQAESVYIGHELKDRKPLARIYAMMGEILSKAGTIEEMDSAENCLKKAIHIDPHNQKAKQLLADVEMSTVPSPSGRFVYK